MRKQLGRDMVYRFRVTELTPNRVAFDATSKGMRFGAMWTIDPLGAASLLTITYRFAVTGLMLPFEPFLKASTRAQMEQAARNVKVLLEAT